MYMYVYIYVNRPPGSNQRAPFSRQELAILIVLLVVVIDDLFGFFSGMFMIQPTLREWFQDQKLVVLLDGDTKSLLPLSDIWGLQGLQNRIKSGEARQVQSACSASIVHLIGNFGC